MSTEPDPHQFRELVTHAMTDAQVRARLSQHLSPANAEAVNQLAGELAAEGFAPTTAMHLASAAVARAMQRYLDAVVPELLADVARTAPRH
ncbi:MAG: hypothetical protein KF863_10665 [Rubrivivax sp.]|nr:hypothetical protein [Rubrivivax sp.]